MVELQISRAASKKAKTSASQTEGENQDCLIPAANLGMNNDTNNTIMTDSHPGTAGATEKTPKETAAKDDIDNVSIDDAEFLECLKATPTVPAKRAPDQRDTEGIRAMAAEARKAGDTVFADALAQRLAGLITKNRPIVATALEASPEEKTDRFEDDGKLTYAIGKVTNHNNIGFTPYLNENIRKKAMAQNLEKQTIDLASIKETTISYKGFPFVPKWDMNFASWTNNHRSFYKTLLNVYGNKKFSALLKQHKDNCEDISDKFCFMVAFRYNLNVRANVFSFCVGAKRQAISDISKRRELVVQECLQTVRNFREIDWLDNLYAPGQPFASIDPLTGQSKGMPTYQSLATQYPPSHYHNANTYAMAYQGIPGSYHRSKAPAHLKMNQAFNPQQSFPYNQSYGFPPPVNAASHNQGTYGRPRNQGPMATASKASNTKASSKAVDYTKIKQFLSNGSNDIALSPLEAQISKDGGG
ncbi:hypothetical protein PCASD_10762 [Puccinia coronata f. sp. avenae]|uniref:Uncharacterized protein n=1 Tax=Puccinia coronata f. sp. avenae TaxID=200324 RepID=A0A2N5UT08_9BASI|nr:hypothetical protein PCASD_10762 [Puccinia coronata f. sp. avenae]